MSSLALDLSRPFGSHCGKLYRFSLFGLSTQTMATGKSTALSFYSKAITTGDYLMIAKDRPNINTRV